MKHNPKTPKASSQNRPPENPTLTDLTQPPSKSRIGWTAFYTAAVWDGLSVPEAYHFVTGRGRFIRAVVGWGGGWLGLAGRYSVTNLFLAPRHLGLNRLLEQSQPPQVVELAAGLSSRGLATTRWRKCVYIEVDQPAVIAFKQTRLQTDPRSLADGAEHHLIGTDLTRTNPTDLARLLKPHLRSDQPVLIIAEGLTGYLGEPALRLLLKSVRNLASECDDATLLVDFYLRLDWTQHGRVALAMWPARQLWKFLRAPMQMFLRDEADLRSFLASTGFTTLQLYSAQDLASLAGMPAPPLNLFYLAELKVNP